MKTQLRVHIAVADHHIRRITEPMIQLRADKAHLIAFKKEDSLSSYVKKTEQILKKNNISTIVTYVDIWNVMECVKKYRKIINKEKGNKIFFNVSTGTKITSIASTLTCMIWNCEPYYAKTDYSDVEVPKTKDFVEEVKEIISIPTYKILSPKPEHLKVLSVLQQNECKMKKKNLIEQLKKMRIISPVGTEFLSKPAEHGQLKTVLDPMLKMQYIDIEAVGRNSVVIMTQQGKNSLEIFGVT